MKINQWKKGTAILITNREALQIIKSLSQQSLTEDPNDKRVEFTAENGEYLTIAVIQNDIIFRGEKITYPNKNNAKCDSCGINGRVNGETLCKKCIDNDTCNKCGERSCNCLCNTKMTIKPLPCPFCGYEEISPYLVTHNYYIQCYGPKCKVNPSIDRPYPTANTAIEAWNQRV